MLDKLLPKLLPLLKEKEPDLVKLFQVELTQYDLAVDKPAIIQSVGFSSSGILRAGLGVESLKGGVTINFKNDFNVTIVLPNLPKITVMVNRQINLVLSQDGLSDIKGIRVQGALGINPSVSSALLKDGYVELKVGIITQKIPLPKLDT